MSERGESGLSGCLPIVLGFALGLLANIALSLHQIAKAVSQ